MPKMKTKQSAAKRFFARAHGFKHAHAFKRHILTKKTAKRKRQLRGMDMVCAADVSNVRAMVPYL